MGYPRIVKGPVGRQPFAPNLQDYDEMRRRFSWDRLSKELDWFDASHINIAHIAVDAHLKTDRRKKKALVWENRKGEVEEFTFEDLSRLSNRFANVLVRETGVEKGDRVFFFLERTPEIFVGILGTLKAGGVIGPLEGFGDQPGPEKENRRYPSTAPSPRKDHSGSKGKGAGSVR